MKTFTFLRLLMTLLLGGVCFQPLPGKADDSIRPAAREFWSFRPLSRPKVPRAGEGWARNPIDRFVARSQDAAGIPRGDRASAVVLVRRAYFDLLGLPPEPREVTARVGGMDDSQYESLINQLLADPRFGERTRPPIITVRRCLK